MLPDNKEVSKLLESGLTRFYCSLFCIRRVLKHVFVAQGIHTTRRTKYLFLRFCVFSDPPQVTQFPRNQKVAEDSIISFFCKASGNPQPRFEWERDGKRINPKRTRYFIFDMPHGSVLRIEPVKARRDQATFTCIADNGIEEPAKANASLTVYPMNRDKGR